jgi:para-nitrobenzyl esterase
MTVLSTSNGNIEGVTLQGGISRFLGIPYAQAPIGPLRFREAVPRQPWLGTRDATRPGPTSPQAEATIPLHRRLASPGWIKGEDTLNLNIWSPDLHGNAPVAVYIYGGAFIEGGGALPMYDGAQFARHGIVSVSLNYRIGVDGFGVFADGPTNLGLLDQVTALEWIRDHIADFGGDPSRVTIFGQSAGGASVAHLMASPRARGLFHAAINQSGPTGIGISRDDAMATTAAVARELGIAATPAAFSTVADDAVVAAMWRVTGETTDPRRRLRISVVNDDEFGGVGEGRITSRVPVVAGFTSDEFLFFDFPEKILTQSEAFGQLETLVTDAVAYTASVRELLPDITWGALVRRTREQHLFVGGVLSWLRHAHEQGLTTWGYEFGWRTQAFDGSPGAYHALDVPFVFDIIDRTLALDMTGPNPPQELADRIHGDWTEFFTTRRFPHPEFDGRASSLTYYDEPDSDRMLTSARVNERFQAFAINPGPATPSGA